ncbi:serine/threonine-protein kinase HipA [Algoriphagus ratkowskyi]|uniref:Serine/threonine-protein kinase HipA n=1 Tax=Algoriphagus ratkowskyi TaxID=57028 RepID=A0A2W7RXI1_9BACT|nr:type II toxin-antitoxin system HipA family toxin [Algoriphagus ratkowskyi]PZX59299.1 serine/threonine-protein kinase HipA [Algoriphagus ratkowskyi]TXD77431.1 type II toxin-antitoxin system HipA family toxin [Algoriphagus ratkowskyi]
MVVSAEIWIWDKFAGAILWDESELMGSFEFNQNFLSSGLDISLIKMPLSQGNRVYKFPEIRKSRGDVFDTFKGLPGLLADMLPDKYGNQLINAWLIQNGRGADSLNPVEQLCFIGKRGVGALEIKPSLRDESIKASSIEIDSLVNIAGKILNSRADFQSNLTDEEQSALSDILKIGTSAGGARAKAVIAFNPKTGAVKSGQVKAPAGFSYWIIKFDGVHDSQFGATVGFGRVEMAYYLMAVAAGVEMSECRLLEENGRAHFMTKRFDREDNGQKIHMQSLCGIRHFDFNQVGFFSYEQVFETMRMLRLSYPEAEQMFIRMVFNVLARNCDDHTKNFAFLMDQNGKWSLSPAYDICYAYRPGSLWVSAQSLTVNGKREEIVEADFLEVARQMNIKKPEEKIAQVKSAVSKWGEFADEVNVESGLRDSIQSTLLI